MRALVASKLSTAFRQVGAAAFPVRGGGLTLHLQRSTTPKVLPAFGLASSRCFAAHSRPQELHRHRKRLEGFGENVAKGDAVTLQKCQDYLKDQDWYARKVAVDAIAKVAKPADEQYLSLLYKHLEDEDIFVREASVDGVAALAREGDSVAISKVTIRFTDEDCFVRARAVAALAALSPAGSLSGDDATMKLLLDEMLDDGFVPVRKNTAQAVMKLSRPGDQTVIRRLQKATSDANKDVRDLAKEAIMQLQP